MTLGERIKYVRKNNKLNQTEFAQILGISQTHVSKIEKGVENPSETLLRFVAYMFAVNLEWLKNEVGEPNDSHKAKEMFNTKRQQLEMLMKYMNESQSLNFLDSFGYYEFIYALFFDREWGFKDNDLITLKEVMRKLFILVYHRKITDDKECEYQIKILKDAIDNFIINVLNG